MHRNRLWDCLTGTIFHKLNDRVMKKNMGSADRIIRTVVAVVIATLYFTNIISGTVAIVLAVLGVVFILTSVVSFCPLYAIFGIKTCKVETAA